MTENELLKDLKKAGFRKIKFFDLGINYTLSTKKWFLVDFKKDILKFNRLNDYISTLKNIPGIEIKNLNKNGFEIIVPALISVAEK